MLYITVAENTWSSFWQESNVFHTDIPWQYNGLAWGAVLRSTFPWGIKTKACVKIAWKKNTRETQGRDLITIEIDKRVYSNEEVSVLDT